MVSPIPTYQRYGIKFFHVLCPITMTWCAREVIGLFLEIARVHEFVEMGNSGDWLINGREVKNISASLSFQRNFIIALLPLGAIFFLSLLLCQGILYWKC